MNFIIASTVSAVIVLMSPFMGQWQSFLRRSLTTRHYVLLFGVGVLVAIGLAMAYAFFRIRERRPQRFGLLAVAAMFGGAYMWLNGTPYPEVNAVERVHFVEYGLVAFLWYRVSRAADPSMVVLPLLVSFMVGTFDEWLQWFIPVRVGEAHDVFLNLASIACGLMFAVALLPRPSFSWTLSSRSWSRIGTTAAVVWLVFAAFVSQVHLGYDVSAEGIGRFHSHHTGEQLLALQKDRANRWDADPPLRLRRLSQEDQYLDEGIWHLRRRNAAEPFEAWHENLILERFFAPVLDIPTYASPSPSRWPLEQRRNVAAALQGDSGTFASSAEPYPIITWRRDVYWLTVGAIALALNATPLLLRRQRNVEPGR